VLGEIMYNSKFYGYVINSAVKRKNEPEKEEPDYQKIGICGIINYLYSTNPNKKYYGLN